MKFKESDTTAAYRPGEPEQPQKPLIQMFGKSKYQDDSLASVLQRYFDAARAEQKKKDIEMRTKRGKSTNA